MLHAVGTLPAYVHEDWVAIIGSREAGPELLQVAYDTAYHLASGQYKRENGEKARRLVVVSGLAIGVDQAAHHGALAAGGHTVAVVPSAPQNRVYPGGHTDLAKRIRQQGCTLHPYQTSIPPHETDPGGYVLKKRLMERNYIVAALCSQIIVISDTQEITGGTTWATYWGQQLGKGVLRRDRHGKWHLTPSAPEKRYTWKTEYPLRPDLFRDLPNA